MRVWLLLLLVIVVPAAIVLLLVVDDFDAPPSALPGGEPSAVQRADVPSTAPPTSSTTTVTTVSTPSTSMPRSHETAPTTTQGVWDRLADCESGAWDRNRNPIPGSADWASTSDGYEGGPHFTNDTWLGAGGAHFGQHANLASRLEQIVVAKIVLRRQGVRAWPICGPKAGLTMAAAA